MLKGFSVSDEMNQIVGSFSTPTEINHFLGAWGHRTQLWVEMDRLPGSSHRARVDGSYSARLKLVLRTRTHPNTPAYLRINLGIVSRRIACEWMMRRIDPKNGCTGPRLGAHILSNEAHTFSCFHNGLIRNECTPEQKQLKRKPLGQKRMCTAYRSQT